MITTILTGSGPKKKISVGGITILCTWTYMYMYMYMYMYVHRMYAIVRLLNEVQCMSSISKECTMINKQKYTP